MTINRNNYEEYFLLYADNELSKTERKIVEIFVQENPDLKEEFSMIKLTINTADEKVQLFDKSFLLKKESPFINENNYEEVFVLYHDDELSDEQKKYTLDFIKENPALITEFELIGKAKIVPENSIVYPGKKQLYRREKSGRVIPMILWRSIAAAVFIGFALWISISYLFKSPVSQPPVTAVNNSRQAQTETKSQSDINTATGKPVLKENIVSSTKTPPAQQTEKNRNETEAPVFKEEKGKPELASAGDEKKQLQSPEEKIIVLNPDVDNQLVVTGQQPKNLTNSIEKIETPLVNDHNPARENQSGTESPEVVHAQTVTYITDAEVNNQNYVFYDVPTEEFKKSKIGGFLKKVSRVVERSNPISRLLAEGDLAANK